jgi:spore maturation protein CgeB
MREYGFVSNRIYDALACGALVLSDHLPELEERFGDAVVTYTDRDQLAELIETLLASPDERARRGELGRRLVLEGYTFAHRIDALLEMVHAHVGRTRRIRQAAATPEPPRRRSRQPRRRVAGALGG